MLADVEILDLLAHCEKATGSVLKQIRGNLRSDTHWLSAVWELVVGEAASMIGRIQYESGEGSQPDWSLSLPDGSRLWLEAAFAQNQPGTAAPKDHPAFRILRSKAAQARASRVTDPVVVCIGTDRVFELGRGMVGRDRDRVVRRFFDESASLSAVIIVPILLRPEVFVGFARNAAPTLLKNPRARSPLSEDVENQLHSLDFNRREATIWTSPTDVRPSLRAAIDKLGAGAAAPSATPSSPSSDSRRFTWSYIWQFNHLGIRQFGQKFGLFNGNEVLGMFPSAEAAAQRAAECFQVFPAHVFGPNGIEPTRDRGVPPDLGEWRHDPSA
jgi:hypothetical protein